MKPKIDWSNPEEVRRYNREQRNLPHNRLSWNAWRRNYRRTIQQNWGYAEKTKVSPYRLSGIPAELFALEELKKYEFTETYHLSGLFPYFPFDVRAKRLGRLCLVQVTTRTHAEDLKRHRTLAELLDADYYVLFVKPDLTKSVLKKPMGNGCELLLKEVLA